MSVTTPAQGQKISDFSAGNVDANSVFIQANNGNTTKVTSTQIGEYSNLNLLFNGAGGLDTTNKTIVGAINEVNGKGLGDIDDVNISSVADGDALIYDSTSSKWVNREIEAEDIPYDNTASGMTATNVQGAIDEVKNDLSNCIRALDVDISGTQINTADSGWYYAEVPFTLPTGAIQLGMFINGGYDASVIPVLGYKKIILLCPTQRTVPSTNRVIRVIYFLP